MKNTLEIEINNYEKPIKELIGKSIFDVNYYEIDYGKGMWDENEFHTLDYGIEIIMSDKSTYYFIWGKEFTQFDVKFRKGNILTEFAKENGTKKHNAKDNINWKNLVGVRIKEIESYWSYSYLMSDKKRNYYPQDIRIEFQNGKEIWISALEITEDRTMGMTDNLTIIFDKKTAEKYNVGINNVS